MTTKEIEKSALKLTPQERAALSYKLLESIDSEEVEEVEEVWQKEIDARYQQILSGKANLKDAELVIKEAKAKYE